MDNFDLSDARVWPMQEAIKIRNRLRKLGKKEAIFETGYGPSGLPHMGTVAEVIRTLMIKTAFDLIKDKNTTSHFIAFVDDMDGFRKVPKNVPNQEMLEKHLGKPLTNVPDPFEEEKSFAAYNSKRFEFLLQRLGCKDQIEILSSTQQYKKGRFNASLIEVLKHHKTILNIMNDHLGADRQATYSPFMPISPVTGHVMQVAMKEYKSSTVVFEAEDGKNYEIPVTDGHCKLQWKPDFGMRWHALNVDYELYGKDLISSVEIATKICKVLGSNEPEGFQYEHFLSPDGGRVSKSKGNESLTIDHWWNYSPACTLEHFLFQNPRRAKRMRIEDLPTFIEAFLNDLNKYNTLDELGKSENAIFYINNKPKPTNVSYKLALSLACALHAPSADFLITKMNVDSNDQLGIEVTKKAYEYFKNEIEANLQTDIIPENMRIYVDQLICALKNCTTDKDALQSCFFKVAKDNNLPMQDWFKMLYKTLIGTEQGPKLGNFCLIYGIDNIIEKLKK